MLSALRRAVAAVLNGLPQPVTRPIELSNTLGLDRSLAWKLWRIAQGQGPFPAPKHIPGRSGARIFHEAAARCGAPADLLDASRSAFEAFEAIARAHASDRAALDIMLGGFTPEGRDRHELALRRQMFRGHAHVLGVQTRTLFRMAVVFPAESGYMPEVAMVSGHFGLERTRPGAAWVLGQSTLMQTSGPRESNRRTALHGGQDAARHAPLLAEFCSRPLPQVRRRKVEPWTFEDELAPGPIGRAGAVDVVLGERIAEIPAEPVSRDAVTMRVRTPSEHLCFDVLLHEKACEATPPTLKAYTLVNSNFPYVREDDRDQIPVLETLTDFGRADVAPVAPEVPRHADLMRSVLEIIGHPAERFRLYRLQMRFAPLPICLSVTYRLRRAR